MEMLQLQYFFEAAKTESLTKTAKKFIVPTSSVSVTISRLEKELGVSLFDRSSNRIVLNENGRRFLKSARLIFSEIESVKHEFQTEIKDTREIKILVLAIRDKLTSHIIKFRQEHRDISFKTVFDYNETNYGDYDIVIGESSIAIEGFDSIEILKSRIRIGASPESPFCNKTLTLKQLENEDFISLGEEDYMQEALTRACKRVGFTPNVVVQCNDGASFDRCIRAGIGIGVIRDRGPDVRLQAMKYLDVEDFNEPYVVCCYYKKREYYGNVKEFIDLLKN